MRKPKKVKRPLGEAPNLDAYSIDEFCERHCISRATFYNLRNDKKGPAEMRPGGRGRVLISKEAAAEWRRSQTI